MWDLVVSHTHDLSRINRPNLLTGVRNCTLAWSRSFRQWAIDRSNNNHSCSKNSELVQDSLPCTGHCNSYGPIFPIAVAPVGIFQCSAVHLFKYFWSVTNIRTASGDDGQCCNNYVQCGWLFDGCVEIFVLLLCSSYMYVRTHGYHPFMSDRWWPSI